MGKVSDTIAVTISAAALLISGLAGRTAASGEDRLDRQEQMQVADRILLEAGPQYARAKHPPLSDSDPLWVVRNGSPYPVDNVWVEGRNGSAVRLWQVQSCTMYGLPRGFSPVAIHFTDKAGDWRRGPGSREATPVSNVFPIAGPSGSWVMDVQGCN
ncbi:hypothetical protein GCM10023258_18080 [Terrabacter aeriphilus]|uniref:Uncharacterized protein n=1 Tax=Terrabacter aeriphilus TaxID=515662 RepID=A0ABP9JAA3_9MICO